MPGFRAGFSLSGHTRPRCCLVTVRLAYDCLRDWLPGTVMLSVMRVTCTGILSLHRTAQRDSLPSLDVRVHGHSDKGFALFIIANPRDPLNHSESCLYGANPGKTRAFTRRTPGDQLGR